MKTSNQLDMVHTKLLAVRPRRDVIWAILLLLVLAGGTALRPWRLGSLSFWYDEVVTMRLAQAPTPAALVHRLFEIDATRAPLQPLLLRVGCTSSELPRPLRGHSAFFAESRPWRWFSGSGRCSSISRPGSGRPCWRRRAHPWFTIRARRGCMPGW